MRPRRLVPRLLAFLAAALLLAGCAGRGSEPAPTVAVPPPTIAVPTPASAPARPPVLVDEDEEEDEGPTVEDSYSVEVRETIDQILELAASPCEGMAAAVREEPARVRDLHGYAAVLQKLVAQDETLGQARGRALADELAASIGTLDRSLAACGITP